MPLTKHWSILFWGTFALLVAVRMPSVAQPAGADQSLYSYVAQEIARGGVPYRDAWDQKPPAIHYTYAALWALWPDESVVAAADLVAATGVALLLLMLGRRVAPGAGESAALLFLLYGNPVFTRLGGVRLRSQCETFIALAITGALVLIYRTVNRDSARPPRTAVLLISSGFLLGLAFVYKYNALVYALPLGLAMLLTSGHSHAAPVWSWKRWPARASQLGLGFIIPVMLFAVIFITSSAWDDLWQATLVYNLEYSGETYRGPWGFLSYLVTFPIQQARVDALWLLGGVACLALLWQAPRRVHACVALAWVVAACLSIAVNGSRNLPQYFVQADPALAFAAGLGCAMLFRTPPLIRSVVVVLLVLAAQRAMGFEKAIDYTWHDVRYLTGQIPADEYLGRFGGQRLEDKYSALAVRKLAGYLREHSRPDQRVLVFGFSPGALVQAPRRSASRFFWSRPLIVGFNASKPGYGPDGLLAELGATQPEIVVLQRHDWEAEGTDSETYFMSQPRLAAWLVAGYDRKQDQDNYSIWMRRTP